MILSDENVTPELQYGMLGWRKTFATLAAKFTDCRLSHAMLIIRVVSNEECQCEFKTGMLDAEINVCAKIDDPGEIIPQIITCVGLIISRKLCRKAI